MYNPKSATEVFKNISPGDGIVGNVAPDGNTKFVVELLSNKIRHLCSCVLFPYTVPTIVNCKFPNVVSAGV
jgi:hypothetical protein